MNRNLKSEYVPVYKILRRSCAKPGALEIAETPEGEPNAEPFIWYGWRCGGGPYVRLYPADSRTFDYWVKKHKRRPRKIYLVPEGVAT